MGPAQSALLGLGATAGIAANKVAGGLQDFKNSKQSKGNSLDNNLKSKLAEISANKGLLDDYTKEYTNFMRTKAMREKRGAWGEKEEKRKAFLESKIKLYSEADLTLSEDYKNTLSKEPGGDK